MQAKSREIELNNFIKKDKFSDAVWKERWLNPSEKEIIDKMNWLLNECAESLIIAINQKYSEKQLKKVLKKGLHRFKKFEYDTEEKELICDYFYTLSKIIEIDFNKELNNWLYGWILSFLLRIKL